MDYEDRWQIIDELGEGGQGKVYRVLDNSKFNVERDIFPEVVKSIRNLTKISNNKQNRKTLFESLRKTVVEFNRMEDSIYHGALKVLHEPKNARDPELQEARVKMEVESMYKVSHPNLLNILDYDTDWDLDTHKWFVSEFHPKGTLVDNKDLFTGNFVYALRAFRSLVEGASKLHKNGIVHRDIKPENVFLDPNNNLVLGDFGLVFFTDAQFTRISNIWENVGSRDWMPGWAMGIRIEDIKPTFDVFCLGKLLWAMVSSMPILRLWYFDQPEFNLERMFPNAPYINLANKLYEKCIVEHEKDCFLDAHRLLIEIDTLLRIIDKNADLIGDNKKRSCRVCGIGNYELLVNRDSVQLGNFGMNKSVGRTFKIFSCSHCGHVQMFHFLGEPNPSAWPNKFPIKKR